MCVCVCVCVCVFTPDVSLCTCDSARLTHRNHVLVLTASGAAEGAGGAGHDGRVGLARVVHHL